MTSGTPINRPVQPRFGAGSGLQSPLGGDDLTNQWKKTKVPSSSTFGLATTVARLVSEMAKLRRRIVTPPGGSGSRFWMYEDHREGDPTLPYDADTFMYLSINNSLVVTGMIDVVSGLTAFSKPGYWQAAQNVPPQTSDTPPKYNVPVFPYPGATGTPTGSPLMGDLDLGQFWFYWGNIQC